MQAFVNRLRTGDHTQSIPRVRQNNVRPSQEFTCTAECLPVRKELFLRRVHNDIPAVRKGLILIDEEKAHLLIFRQSLCEGFFRYSVVFTLELRQQLLIPLLHDISRCLFKSPFPP